MENRVYEGVIPLFSIDFYYKKNYFYKTTT